MTVEAADELDPLLPETILNCSTARCPDEPLPAEAKLIGRVFPSAINSFTEVAGSDGCTIKIFGTEMPCVMAAKSRTGSKRTSRYKLGLIATPAAASTKV